MPQLAMVMRLTTNRDAGRGGSSPRRIFLHSTRGPGDRHLELEYRATVNYFLQSGVQASAHVVVGPSETTRMVMDGDTAWHASENNPTSLSIEIAQPESQPDFTDYQYGAVAAICNYWCEHYRIPRVRIMSQADEGIIGHEDSEQGKRYGKSDPGDRWDWGRFLAILDTFKPAPTPTGPDLARIRGEMDRLWHISNLLEGISAHDTAAVVRQAVATVKGELGIP